MRRAWADQIEPRDQIELFNDDLEPDDEAFDDPADPEDDPDEDGDPEPREVFAAARGLVHGIALGIASWSLTLWWWIR